MAHAIIANYNNLTAINYHIEKEYHEVVNKYKKIIVFILKNKLPINKAYFNAASKVTYNLLPIKELNSSESPQILGKHHAATDRNISSIKTCYHNECIQLLIDRNTILTHITKKKLGTARNITMVPFNKMTLLQASSEAFLTSHKNFLIITLAYLFIFYLFQALVLFIKNLKLTKSTTALLATAGKIKQELAETSTQHKKLSDSILLTHHLINEYFIHYLHQLIIRDIYLEEASLTDLVFQIEKFFSYQIIKRKLTIAIESVAPSELTKTDNEIIFLILLNSIFKAICRAKIASELVIKIGSTQEVPTITINDIGYEYQPKLRNKTLNNKIQIGDLPMPILKNLYQKVAVEVMESRDNEVNIIVIKFNQDCHLKKLNKIIKLDSSSKVNNPLPHPS